MPIHGVGIEESGTHAHGHLNIRSAITCSKDEMCTQKSQAHMPIHGVLTARAVAGCARRITGAVDLSGQRLHLHATWVTCRALWVVENALFFGVLSLCLSRACLGKMISFSIEWREKTRVLTWVVKMRPIRWDHTFGLVETEFLHDGQRVGAAANLSCGGADALLESRRAACLRVHCHRRAPGSEENFIDRLAVAASQLQHLIFRHEPTPRGRWDRWRRWRHKPLTQNHLQKRSLSFESFLCLS